MVPQYAELLSKVYQQNMHIKLVEQPDEQLPQQEHAAVRAQ